MATKQEITERAKEIIASNPTAGKTRVNRQLREEFGKGLRSSTILKLKGEVATEKPSLYPLLYARGSVPKELRDIYNGWKQAGFLTFEARELTLGHGERYRSFDAKAVFDSIPGQKARETRLNLVRQQFRDGWTKKQIRDNIIDFYIKGRKVGPWEHIRAEYKPRQKQDYSSKARIRAKAKQKRLKRSQPIATTRAEWIEQLKQKISREPSPQRRNQFRQQIINLGGTP